MSKKILTPLRSYQNKRVYYIYKEYLEMFKKNGFDLIVIGPISSETLHFLVDQCDALLLTGGIDVNPQRYHEKPHPKTNCELPSLEELEFTLIKLFNKQDKPIFGICRGLQTINVAFNGTLQQDLDNHLQTNLIGYCHHIKTLPNSILTKYLPLDFMTNSFHHQAIAKIAPGFIVSAISDDGTIEAIEKNNIIGVQWHPEKNDDKIQAGLLKLFSDLLEET